MTTNQQSNNGNEQLNAARNSFNSKVSKYKMLGGTKKVQWDNARRNRSI
tara:strand:- start:297 stop:443 length:147 start_codon:yes stop_codon:yes gene_type:complete